MRNTFVAAVALSIASLGMAPGLAQAATGPAHPSAKAGHHHAVTKASAKKAKKASTKTAKKAAKKAVKKHKKVHAG